MKKNALPVKHLTQKLTELQSVGLKDPEVNLGVLLRQNLKLTEKAESKWYCEICMEDLPKTEFPILTMVTKRCYHTTKACSSCISQSIASQLNFKPWNLIECPVCPARLKPGYVEELADKDTVNRYFLHAPSHQLQSVEIQLSLLRRYHRFMIADAMKDDPRFRQCLRSSCNFGQIHEAGDQEPVMRCGDCGYKMCYVHNMPWHEDQTCTDYDYMMSRDEGKQEEDEASTSVIAKTSKPCPGEGCSVPITQNGGCDHMTCK